MVPAHYDQNYQNLPQNSNISLLCMTFDGILVKTNQHHHQQQHQQQQQTYVKDPEQECSRSKKLCSGKLLYLVDNHLFTNLELIRRLFLTKKIKPC